MGYLEQFARNRRSKEKTEVLTARLPESLYSDFKDYCEELGLSISEAVYLLVEREMSVKSKKKEIKPIMSQFPPNTIDDKEYNDVVTTNTKANTSEVEEISTINKLNTSAISPKLTKQKAPLKKEDDFVKPTIKAPHLINDDVRANTKSTTSRFTTKPWQVNGELPCPTCGQWVSSSNFARHAKSHGTTTQDIFTNERYLQKATEMIQERKDGKC